VSAGAERGEGKKGGEEKRPSSLAVREKERREILFVYALFSVFVEYPGEKESREIPISSGEKGKEGEKREGFLFSASLISEKKKKKQSND